MLAYNLLSLTFESQFSSSIIYIFVQTTYKIYINIRDIQNNKATTKVYMNLKLKGQS